MHEKRLCLLAWEYIKKYARPDVAALMGDTPIYRNDKTTLPLQAADLYAYWVRRWENEGITDGIEKLSFGWKVNKVETLPRIDFSFEEKDFIFEFNRMLNPEVIQRAIDDGPWDL
jgi:hypothetical protein